MSNEPPDLPGATEHEWRLFVAARMAHITERLESIEQRLDRILQLLQRVAGR